MTTPPQRTSRRQRRAKPISDETTRDGTRWDQYGPCRLCCAKSGKPCFDTRGFTKGELYRPIKNPHYGYRRLVYRTYRDKKIFQ